jgi:cytochrome d ubiquinol oxidase subunit II
MMAALDLPLIWACLIAFAVLAYIVLDGFDLGTGILFLLEPETPDRDIMVNTIAPVWDGNETWLILGGGGLFAVFPLAYSVIMPALYPAVITMLLALVFRGVAFEFRFRADSVHGRAWWDTAFCGGSIIAAFCQGLVLGGVMQGIHVVNRTYAGGWWDWLSPFTVLCGFAVVIGYGLLGATWLVWRTEGDLQQRSRRHAGWLAIATFLLIVAVSIWTPLLYPAFTARWFAFPGIIVTSPVPILVAAAGYGLWHGLTREGHITPFLCALAWFVLCFIGLGISLWPNIVPPSITFRDAAAPPESQGFLLVGAVVLLPIILVYTGYAYYLFRGKVGTETHYH